MVFCDIINETWCTLFRRSGLTVWKACEKIWKLLYTVDRAPFEKKRERERENPKPIVKRCWEGRKWQHGMDANFLPSRIECVTTIYMAKLYTTLFHGIMIKYIWKSISEMGKLIIQGLQRSNRIENSIMNIWRLPPIFFFSF